MRAWTLGIGIALLGLLVWKGSAEDAEPKGPERVVTGEVVDLSCYLMMGARGEAHRGCAQACLSRGSPAGILTDDGQVVVILYDPKNARPVELGPFMAKRVQARGVAYAKGGITGLVVASVAPVAP